jgi:hypothetical protein
MTDKYYEIVPREIHSHVSMSYIHVHGNEGEIEDIRRSVTAKYRDITEMTKEEFDKVSHVSNLAERSSRRLPDIDEDDVGISD